jgi:hypothetical protein
MKNFIFKQPIVPVYAAPINTGNDAEYDTPFKNETAQFESPFKDELNPPVLKKPTSDIVKKRPAKFGN